MDHLGWAEAARGDHSTSESRTTTSRLTVNSPEDQETSPTFQGAPRPVRRAKPSFWSIKQPRRARAWQPSTHEIEVSSRLWQPGRSARSKALLQVDVAFRPSSDRSRSRVICLLYVYTARAQLAAVRAKNKKISALRVGSLHGQWYTTDAVPTTHDPAVAVHLTAERVGLRRSLMAQYTSHNVLSVLRWLCRPLRGGGNQQVVWKTI